MISVLPDMVILETNKAVIRRFIQELWNQRKVVLADDLFAEDCTTHQLRVGADPAGAPRAEAIKHHVTEWLAAFPDIRFTVEQMLPKEIV